MRTSLKSLKRNSSHALSCLGGKTQTYALLAVATIEAVALNLWIVSIDNRPPPWDYAYYLTSSLRIYNAMKGNSVSNLLVVLGDPYRPPLVPLLASPFYFIFGMSYNSAMFESVVFMAILSLATFKLTARLTSSNLAGAIGAGIVMALPGIIIFARIFGLDFPLAALVVLGLYLVAASDGFRKRKVSIMLGLVAGLGMLTKWSYFIYIAPMILAEIVQKRRTMNLRSMLLAGIVAVCLSLPWYANALNQGLIGNVSQWFWGPSARVFAAPGSNSIFDVAALSFYLTRLYAGLMGPLYSAIIVLIFGLVLLLRRKKALQCNGAKHLARSMAFAILVSFAWFMLLESKVDRYLLPILPAAVILTVYAGWQIRAKEVELGRFLLLGVLLISLIVTPLGVTMPQIGYQLGIYDTYYTQYTPSSSLEKFYGYDSYGPPLRDDWRVTQIIKSIADLNPNAKVAILASHWVFNEDTFTYYETLLGVPGIYFRDFRDYLVVPPFDDLNYYDFVLMKTALIGNQTDHLVRILDRLKIVNDPFYSSHKMIQSFPLPDGSRALLFMRICPDQNQPSCVPSQKGYGSAPIQGIGIRLAPHS